MTGKSFQVPQEPFLIELFHHWRESPQHILIRDRNYEKEATVSEFLQDILFQCQFISERLDSEIHSQLQKSTHDVFIALLARPGYEFAVLFFANYGLGAVAVPLAPRLFAEEFRYGGSSSGHIYVSRVNAYVLEPQPMKETDPQFVLCRDKKKSNPEKGFSLLYTSGTTGLPKGVLYSRRSACIGFKAYADLMGLSSRDTWLHNQPLHWKRGFDFFLVCIFSGACVELCNQVYNPTWFWWRMRQGGVTIVYMAPMLLDSLVESLKTIQQNWLHMQYEEALNGLQNVRFLGSGSMRVPQSTKDTWRALRRGRPLVILYGTTEVAGLLSMTDWKSNASVPPCNPHAMDDAFDGQGFFKTGDFGRIEDGKVFVLGRRSQDVIRFLGRKIYGPEIEDALCEHPHVSRALVVGVAEPGVDQRLAALLVERLGSPRFCLLDLRRWLAIERGIPAFKLPTLLRTIPEGHPLPVTDSGKPMKSRISNDFLMKSKFPTVGLNSGIFRQKNPKSETDRGTGREEQPLDVG
ncbi:class I adenylate-forming enzyme family protein [Aspergillus alliaceus]|uniref:class I adenylate-forming enzyme family protein n=1 Tax=Petromyces alliaceus TaxID=209559 RepID=UPI0012A707F1|nr:uncharacterized protein BDW43DRAFT_315918 [Aspergillus alliaceus]KAB8228418.1 hypothetical protein BDW43DRAFT_315918 [Aspergillus alliaceus]